MKKRYAYHVLFWVYCILMALLLFGRSRFSVENGYWNTLSQHLSLTPLHTIRLFINVLVGDYGEGTRRSAIINLFGNVAMFLPLGFLPPLLWKPFQKFWKMLLWGGLIIISVELIQLFTLVGNCDVDDLLLNLVGIALGYGLYGLTKWLTDRRLPTENNP